MKKLLAPALLFLALTLQAQPLPITSIDSLFGDWDTPYTPGCALGIFQDGEIAYARGYGLANLEYDIPISEQSVFRIGSTSKQFTAACIVLLSLDGKLSLDDPLRKFFPEFPTYGDTVTVRHMILHTSGIRDYLVLSNLKGYGDHDFYTDQDVLRWLIRQKQLNFAPGEEWMYSNSGYWLLGQIVEKVSGKNMAEYAREKIFGPLGMTNTHFHNDHTMIVKNRASGYAPDSDSTFRISMTTLDMIGDGGIFTTIEDIKKWDDSFFDGNVLPEKFWDLMTTPGVLNNGDTLDYAGGLFIEKYKGLPVISHGGAFVGFRAELMRFPDQKTTIAIFANRADANPTRLAYQVADLILKPYLSPEEQVTGNKKPKNPSDDNPVEEIPFDKLTGTYNMMPGLDLAITIENDSLHIEQQWDGLAYNVARISPNTYVIPGEDDVVFVFSDLQYEFTQTLMVKQSGQEIKGKRKAAFDPASVRLEDFVGRFYSDELDVLYELSIQDNKLILSINGREPRDLKTDGPDTFTTRWWRLSYAREEGKVTGFDMEAGRVKGLRFEKVRGER